jgi:hypothetical protein
MAYFKKCPLTNKSLEISTRTAAAELPQLINDIIKRALVQAKIPAVNEPSGLSRADGKRPDGLTLTTWKTGKCLIWDVTVADTACQSYINHTTKMAGSAADMRETIKTSEY